MSGSLEKEVAVGRQAALEIEKELKMVDDPLITEYVNRVGQNIVLHSDAKVPFTIKVVDSDEINAFALPGGFFFVNKGLVLAADNESEIAGVMAHEIAHVTARHAMEQQAKGMLAQIGLTAASIFIPGTLAGAGIFNGAQSLDAVVNSRWDLFVSHRVAFGAVGDCWLLSHIVWFVIIRKCTIFSVTPHCGCFYCTAPVGDCRVARNWRSPKIISHPGVQFQISNQKSSLGRARTVQGSLQKAKIDGCISLLKRAKHDRI